MATIDQIAEFPTARGPKTVSSPNAILRAASAKTCVAVTARRNRPRDNALPFLIPGDRGSQFLYDPDGFVTNRQALCNRILAFQNVDVSSANRRSGDFEKGVERANLGNRLLNEDDTARFGENGGPTS